LSGSASGVTAKPKPYRKRADGLGKNFFTTDIALSALIG
jgi:hypothetical protein